MKQFNDDFKEKLYATIEDIEDNSMVEVVAVIKPNTAKYRDVSLWSAFVFMAAMFSFFMFMPWVLSPYVIYLLTLFAFPLGYFLMELMPNLKRAFISKKRMLRQSEIMARAVFQKGGIRHTMEKIGVLFFVGLFERSVIIVPDRGAETSIPIEDWEEMNRNFAAIFSKENKSEAFIEALKKTKPIFAENIPPIENDINELPDDLEVEI